MDAELTKLAEACERAAEELTAPCCPDETCHACQPRRDDANTLRILAAALRAGRVTVSEGGASGA